MWTRRKLINLKSLCSSEHEAVVVTTTFAAQQSSSDTVASLTLERDEFNCAASLAYTMVPEVSEREVFALSSWCFQRWVRAGTRSDAVVSFMASNPKVRGSFSQIEYFFAGTDNGQLFMVPLMPPHLIHAIRQAQPPSVAGDAHSRDLFLPLQALTEAARGGSTSADAAAVSCGPRRLLHQHAMEEPVTAVDHVGTVIASGSDDRSIAVSFFHPVPTPIVTWTQPSPIRCLKLWEGAAFGNDTYTDALADETTTAQQRRVWHERQQAKERAAVYLFAGDEAALVRLWRVDVQAKDYVLLHVLVCAQHTRPVRSALDMLSMEDPNQPVVGRETTKSIHCLAIDGDARLIAGTQDGLYVWNLAQLSWKSNDVDLDEHPLCWDEAQRCPLSVSGLSPPSQLAMVKMRASRLVNLHVVLRHADVVRAQLETAGAHLSADAPVKAHVSKWKPKYGRAVTSGAAVGSVVNTVYIPSEADTPEAVLKTATVSLSFEDGELHNDIRVPLSCVEPVVYPLCALPTYRSHCYAVEVLQPHRRLISSGSNGSIILWQWSAEDGAGDDGKPRYVPTVIAGGGKPFFRGLGRRLCVLRAPDVFLSCGYDDGMVKEWHVYEEPERMVRCERRFTMMPAEGYARAARGGGGAASHVDAAREAAEAMTALVNGRRAADEKDAKETEVKSEVDEEDDTDPDAWRDGGEVVGGISCAVAFPAFAAVFLVGAFEHVIQTFTLSEVQGCEAPRNFIYNGFKTVKLPASLVEDAYRQLDVEPQAQQLLD